MISYSFTIIAFKTELIFNRFSNIVFLFLFFRRKFGYSGKLLFPLFCNITKKGLLQKV